MTDQPASGSGSGPDVPESGITMLTGSDLPGTDPAEAGEAACYAYLVCPDCGSVVTEGHQPGCPAEAGRGQVG